MAFFVVSCRFAPNRQPAGSARKPAWQGVDLRGYFHWSLTDNFEWNEGWHLRFGLIGLDPRTHARSPRPSARLYEEIIRKSRNGTEKGRAES